MNTQLLDIDIDIDIDLEVDRQQPRSFFVYNQTDRTMFCFSMSLIVVILGFFIWFGIAHAK